MTRSAVNLTYLTADDNLITANAASGAFVAAEEASVYYEFYRARNGHGWP